MPRRRLGDILIERGVLSEEQLQQALERQRETTAPLGTVVIEMGFVTAEQIADALAEHLQVPRAVWNDESLNPELALLVPAELLKEGHVFPIGKDGQRLKLAMVDPLDIFTIDAVRQQTGLFIEPVVATATEIQAAYDRAFNLASVAQGVIAEIEEEPEEDQPDLISEQMADSPGVKVVNLILVQAVRDRASDVHIEPREDYLLVRFRVDGILREEMRLPKPIHPDVTLRLKVMAGLDITERRRPQDGRMKVTIEEQAIDMRISVLPTIYGEKTVLRLLNKNTAILRLDDTGFLPASLQALERMLASPHGLILVTGPTGSGKTTTQYALLNRLNSPNRNIITVEDPVEYRLDGVNQVQVNAKIGFDFAANLRAVLRQDPDVVMVGEIRDRETADIAVRAALTGHLVLSTLHTNSACGAITRLLDMGVEPFLLSATLIGVVSQRLVRSVCPSCKAIASVTDPAEERFLHMHGVEISTLWRGQGCQHCKQSGLYGRIPVEEVLPITRELRRTLTDRPTEQDLFAAARKAGFRTLVENGITKVAAGHTTVHELWRTLYSLEDDISVAADRSPA